MSKKLDENKSAIYFLLLLECKHIASLIFAKKFLVLTISEEVLFGEIVQNASDSLAAKIILKLRF